MTKTFMLALVAATSLVAPAAVAQSPSDNARFQSAQDNFNRERQIFRDQSRYRQSDGRYRQASDRMDRAFSAYRSELDRYQQTVRASGYASNGGYNNNGYNNGYNDNYQDDPNYDPARYYRDGNYQERVLSSDDRVYRGNDGRYYCKRTDGTTGLIVGAGAGGLLGNVIDGGHSRGVGTILGAVGGALAGRAIERSADRDANGQIRCR
ncbi:17 kDa surface antigen [Sphingomonas antarctica]|uniref:glycine zipper 2TM domain-containing protein n=1 Tax=Sphingomonas antarctica TaxID=2040274 RepID=UPI0039EB5D54